TDAGRHSPHPDRERKAARARRARRQFRLRLDRSAAGATVGRSENRDHDATAAAVERSWGQCGLSARACHTAPRGGGGVATHRVRIAAGKAGGPPHKNSKASPLQPGDEVGAYTYAQLLRMDRRYVAAAEEANSPRA